MTFSQDKTIYFFGIYDPTYARNVVLQTGLRAHGWRVVDCRVDPRGCSRLGKYRKLLALLLWAKKQPGPIFVAYPGQTVLWLAKIFAPKKKIIFDAFTSLYDSNVFDRQLYSARSLRGLRDYFLDYTSWRLADFCLTDTLENLKYWQREFGYRKNCLSVFVGSKIKQGVVGPNRPDDGRLIVHFHGHYIPLQGVDCIIKAAKILSEHKEIVFRIIGQGQEYEKIRHLARELEVSNIEFLPEMDFENLQSKISEADIVLGIFGSTDKAMRVIPNKVFEGLALGKPVLTAETPAVKELLVDNITVAFCRSAGSNSLAEKILFLKENEQTKKKIGENAERLYNDKLRPEKIVAGLSGAIERYV